MERPHQPERTAAEHRRSRTIPKSRQITYDESLSDPTTADLDVEGITEELKKAFRTIYKKHGSLKERRDLNVKYRHVGCEQCLKRKKPCEIRATALQCGNCPPYVKCTRVPILKKLRVLDLMPEVSEQQYEALLTWYKQTVEDELLKPLRETLHLEQATKAEPSNPLSSDEMESGSSPDPFLNQVVPVGGPGVDMSQAYREESPSRELNVVRIDNRNASRSDRTRLPRPSKIASNPYPPVAHVFPSHTSREHKQDWQREDTPSILTPPYHNLPPLSYHSPPPDRLPAASALYRVPSSFYRSAIEDGSCSNASDVQDAQRYSSGHPGQFSSAVNWNRPHDMHIRTAENVSSPSLAPYYSGGTSYYVNGPTSYGYHSQSSRSPPESNFSRSQRSSPYSVPPEATKLPQSRSWSADASTGGYSSGYTRPQETEGNSPESFTQFEDTKPSPHLRSMWDGEAANEAYESYYGHHGVEHLYRPNATP
ncbi:hypothetical protein FB446DRAFT_773654 [Lentinula raphanica]|nr:hypothetical protein FB446DRAFT_773654 [Lentinula raphanica]